MFFEKLVGKRDWLRGVSICFIIMVLTPVIYSKNIDKLFSVQQSLEYAKVYDSLYGYNKEIPEEYKSIFYTALAYYPSLYNVKIIIREDKIKSTLVVRPTVSSLLKKNGQRVYQIVIDTNKFALRGYNLKKAHNARIGAMGHELGHIFDYESKTNWEVMVMGFRYVFSDEYHKHTERWTDSLTAEHHLGEQLLAFNEYVNNSPFVSAKYRLMKKKYYLSTKEIERQLAAIHNRSKLKIVKDTDIF